MTQILRIGLFDTAFSGYDPSITHLQKPPLTLQYIPEQHDPDLVDLVLATCEDAHRILNSPHPRKVLWLQETSEGHPPTDLDLYRKFSLVLTNDQRVLDQLPNSRWLSLVGTWITDFTVPEKTRLISFIAKRHVNFQTGYVMRERVARAVEGLDKYGTLFNHPIPFKDEALKPYRFHIVVENASYRYWMTEKLFDAFACKAVPLYWGSDGDLTKLASLGFDTDGIFVWRTIAELQLLMTFISNSCYDGLAAQIEHNYHRIQQLYCTETLLEPLLREHFSL